MSCTITVPNESDVSAIVAALRVAAVQYSTDAQTCRDHQRLYDGFLAQARRANDLADKIERQPQPGDLDDQGRDSVDRGEMAACRRGGDPS